MKRLIKLISLLLASLIAVGSLASCSIGMKSSATTVTTEPFEPIIGRADMMPSEIWEILPDVEWVKIQYKSKGCTDVYTKDGDTVYREQDYFSGWVYSSFNQFWDFDGHLLYYGNGAGEWVNRSIPEDQTWETFLKTDIFNDERILPAFENRVYRTQNADGSYDANIGFFSGVQSLNFKGSGTTYTFEFEVYEPGLSSDSTVCDHISITIRFVKIPLDLPKDATPDPNFTTPVT